MLRFKRKLKRRIQEEIQDKIQEECMARNASRASRSAANASASDGTMRNPITRNAIVGDLSGDRSLRHKSWKSVPEQKTAFFQKRYREEVEQELQRVRTTLSWIKENEWPPILYARILADHQIEDILLESFSERYPIEMLVIESGKGLFVKRPGKRVQHYHRPFSEMKGHLIREERLQERA